MATDFVPIEPYQTNVLTINVGQRYDIVVEASQESGNFWLRADPQFNNGCGARNNMAGNIRGVVTYEGSQTCQPTSASHNYTTGCRDEPNRNLVPVFKVDAGAKEVDITQNVIIRPTDDNTFRWYLSGSTFEIDGGHPTLQQVYRGESNYTESSLAIDIPGAEQWVYIIIESRIPLPHPIHLHGHDFIVVGSGTGSYNGQNLNLVNPPRRDVVLMPARGYLVLAFLTDNPGTWLMHCHIGWHASMG